MQGLLWLRHVQQTVHLQAEFFVPHRTKRVLLDRCRLNEPCRDAINSRFHHVTVG